MSNTTDDRVDDKDALLSERGSTHGDSFTQMTTTASFWTDYLVACGWTPPQHGRLHADQADMMMNLLKVSRSAHGNPHFDDHYDDLMGYTQMAKDHVARRGSVEKKA